MDRITRTTGGGMTGAGGGAGGGGTTGTPGGTVTTGVTGTAGTTGTTGGNTGTNRALVPEAKEALNRMKFEVAGQLGVNLTEGYNGNLTAREAGYVGGFMVKRMIEQVERQMAGK